MEEPIPEPNVQEVPINKCSKLVFRDFPVLSEDFMYQLLILFLPDNLSVPTSKKDSDLQPIKSGTLVDLDEDAEKAEEVAVTKPTIEVNNIVGNLLKLPKKIFVINSRLLSS